MGYGNYLLAGLAFLIGMADVAAQDRYAVFYKHKPQTTFSLEVPSEFLSGKALARRVREGVMPDSLDLPVTQRYIDSVSKKADYVLYSSKWLNATLLVATEVHVSEIAGFPFVERVELVARGFTPPSAVRMGEAVPSRLSGKLAPPTSISGSIRSSAENAYDFQNQLLGIPEMHAEGYTGKGVTVAVFDAGFPGVPQISALGHLISGGKIIGTRDFVVPWNKDVYTANQHGTNVLSLIASNEPGVMEAGAPDADFILVLTEDVATEYRIEEYNWVRGAEYADSLGVDIINSSLGYWDFDEEAMNYSLEDLDGETATISKGAAIAARKGILITTSVGNYGSRGAPSLIAPADVGGLLAIGSVDRSMAVSGFSSRGPTGDGRIKPDLVSMGTGVALVRANGLVGTANGTSFSAPQIAALAAGLWEAKPEWTKDELIGNLLRSATQADAPDNDLGYGVPNFRGALYGDVLGVDGMEVLPWKVFPNPLSGDQLSVYFGNGLSGEFSLMDMTGRLIKTVAVIRASSDQPYRVELQDVKPGLYILQMQDGAIVRRSKLFRR